jgi:hypothetical protein
MEWGRSEKVELLCSTDRALSVTDGVLASVGLTVTRQRKNGLGGLNGVNREAETPIFFRRSPPGRFQVALLHPPDTSA